MFCSQFHSAVTALTITIKSALNEIYRALKNVTHFEILQHNDKLSLFHSELICYSIELQASST